VGALTGQPTRRALPGVALLAVLVAGACRLAPAPDGPEAEAASGARTELASVDEAFRACVDGDPSDGLADLDALLADAPRDPDALVARGLCRWARWGDTADAADVSGAYEDLSAAIAAVEGGRRAHGTALDQIYNHRAFVARALDGSWVRTLEDLDRAVALAPIQPTYVLDRGVVHSYAGDSAEARADLRRFLTLADSADTERRAVVETLLDRLGPGPADSTARAPAAS